MEADWCAQAKFGAEGGALAKCLIQRQRVADNYPGADAYYSAVLTLFGQGWDQHRFRFNARGELLPDWGQECANSH